MPIPINTIFMVEYEVKDRSIYMAAIKPGKQDSKVPVRKIDKNLSDGDNKSNKR